MYRPKAEYRAPRPGEVLSFLSRHARKVEAGEGLNIRITPCPTCARTKDTTATTVHTQTGLWFCWACQAKGNFFTLTRAFGSPLAEDDRYLEPPELCRQKIDKGWREMRTKGFAHQRRPVVDGHYPELLAYLHARGFSDATLYDWRVSTMGPKALRWPLYARDQAGEWSLCNSRLRVCIDRATAKTTDWFEVTGGETNLLIGNHLLDLAGPKRVIVTEGQCFPPTAEVLTKKGWIQFKDYNGESMMQVMDNGVGKFVLPKASIVSDFDGELLRYENQSGYLTETTPDHSIPFIKNNGEWFKRKASEIPANGEKIPRVCDFSGLGLPFSNDQIALCLAISADGAIDKRKTEGALRYCRLALKRERKIERFIGLLERLDIDFTTSLDEQDKRFFGFKIPTWVPGRMLDWEWLPKLSKDQRNFILDELVHWDGNSVVNRNQTQYSSKYLDNAQWVQTLAHTTGRCSSVHKRIKTIDGYDKEYTLYQVNILHGKKTSSMQKPKWEKIPYVGKVYCVQVPSGFFLVRQEGKISVTGNCDAMTAYEIGLRNVFSLPNGASHVDVARMLRYVPDDWEVWIASDMDKAGDLCAEAFFAALGPDRLARVHMPAKDLNAWHLDLGLTLTPKMIEAALVGFTRMSTAAKLPLPVSASSHWMDLTKDDEAVRPVAICDTPWPLLTELLDGGLKPSQTTGVLAPSGTGKTTIVTQWGIHAAASKVKTGIITLEGDKTSIASKIKEQIRGYCSPSQMADISRYLLVSQLNGSSVKWTEVVSEMEVMAQEGCKLIIVDNLDYIMPRTSMNIATQQKIQAYGRIMDIGKEYDIHSLVVWQPLKIEAGQVVNSGHQKGAAQLFQDADNYLNLNHIDGLARLEIEKCRDIGGKGGQVWLRYEATKRCLFEVAAPSVDSAVDAALPLGSVSKLNFALARSDKDDGEIQALPMT